MYSTMRHEQPTKEMTERQASLFSPVCYSVYRVKLDKAKLVYFFTTTPRGHL